MKALHLVLPGHGRMTLVETAEWKRVLAELEELREEKRVHLVERDRRLAAERRRRQEETTRRNFVLADKTPTEPIRALNPRTP